jgi:hypothetical protein
MNSEAVSLAEWETFCVVVGAAAAALTGLMFVVIVLGADRKAFRSPRSVSGFATPNVLHFCAVLLICTLLSFPGHTRLSLAACCGSVGFAGAVLTLWVFRLVQLQEQYKMILADWVWYVTVPLLAYLALTLSAAAAMRGAAWVLHVIAAATVVLLFVGVHNAWDTAVYLAIEPGDRSEGGGGSNP